MLKAPDRMAGASRDRAGAAVLADLRRDRLRSAASGARTAATEGLTAFARIVDLDEGLHLLNLGPVAGYLDAATKLALPLTAVCSGPGDYHRIEIARATGERRGWISATGGSVIVKVPREPGVVVITTYGVSGEAALPPVSISRVDRRADGLEQPVATAASGPDGARAIEVEIDLYIEREGARRLPGRDWVGNPGGGLRIEAFGIRPLVEAVGSDAIEYMAFGPGGRQTRWVTNAGWCGTRGLGMPLTGFAVRLAPRLHPRFDVIYEGSFFESGAVGPMRNGEVCLSSIPDDPLEAIRLRVTASRGD